MLVTFIKMDSRGCHTPPCHRHHSSKHHCPPHHMDHFKLFPSCLLDKTDLPSGHCHGHCHGVCPPKVQNEIVVFRKTYKCHMTDKTQDCDKDCPYVRTVQYTIEPVWEHLDSEKLDPEICRTLNSLKYWTLPHNSSLSQCLQCHFDRAYIHENKRPDCRSGSLD